MQRFLLACKGDECLANKLYKENIRLSVDMFAVVGAFEIALRNAIDVLMKNHYGRDWLKDAVSYGGFFNVPQCRDHARIIRTVYTKLSDKNEYTHEKLLSKLEFGVWKYMFSNPQYRASGRLLLRIFPNKPVSTRFMQYNNTTIFNELDHVNSLRNRIAHHEPICFPAGCAEISTDYAEWIYLRIVELFGWMGIDHLAYLEDVDHVMERCQKVKDLKLSVIE